MPSNQSVKKALAALEQDKSKTLSLTIGKHVDFETALYIPRAEAQSAPEMSFSAASADKTYLMIALDLDAPFISVPILGPILHWIQPGFKVSASAPGKLASTEPPVAEYIGPAPPPGAAPHRYVFFLYEQPAGFEGKKFAPTNGKPYPVTSRMFTSLDDWEKKMGLGEVVAVNYFKSN